VGHGLTGVEQRKATSTLLPAGRAPRVGRAPSECVSKPLTGSRRWTSGAPMNARSTVPPITAGFTSSTSHFTRIPCAPRNPNRIRRDL
jgi:hypothetical protein